jgi:hypothetical protein
MNSKNRVFCEEEKFFFRSIYWKEMVIEIRKACNEYIYYKVHMTKYWNKKEL